MSAINFLSSYVVNPAVGGISGYVAGYIYGNLFKSDPHISGLVFAVNTIALTFLRTFLQDLTQSNTISGKLQVDFYSTTICCIAHILAMRHFNIIAEKGTLIWSCIALLSTASQIREIQKLQAAPGL